MIHHRQRLRVQRHRPQCQRRDFIARAPVVDVSRASVVRIRSSTNSVRFTCSCRGGALSCQHRVFAVRLLCIPRVSTSSARRTRSSRGAPRAGTDRLWQPCVSRGARTTSSVCLLMTNSRHRVHRAITGRIDRVSCSAVIASTARRVCHVSKRLMSCQHMKADVPLR